MSNLNDLFKYIVVICNDNQGFISAILTCMTIVISVIAIVLSNKIGSIPYKKKLKAIPGIYMEDDQWMMDVMIINYGLMTLVIEGVTIKDAKQEYVGGTYAMEPIVLEPAAHIKLKISIEDYNGLIEKYSMNLNNKIVIEVREYGGRVFKFKNGFPVG